MPSKKDAKAKDKDTKASSSSSSSGKKSDKAASSSSKDAGGANEKLKAANSVNVRHILCEKHSKKEEALAKLNAGVKFDDVAREFSEDKARQGGSLGWKPRGSLLPAFETAAYALPVSTTGAPKWAECRTGEGYHLLIVEGRR